MCRNRFAFLAVAALIACGWLLSLPGCSPGVGGSDQQDEKNPYFQKGRQENQKHDYKKAMEYFQQALEMDSHNAAAHLELGLLYEEKMQDYAYAIYHYRRYLELRPQTEKADLIKQFVDRCQLALAASLKNSPIDCGDEINRLHQDNSNLLQQVEYLSKNNQDLELKVAKLSHPPDEEKPDRVVTQLVYVTPPTPITNQAVAQPSHDSTPVRPSVNPARNPSPTTTADISRPRTYVVQPHDTLRAISQKMYGRPDKWQLIYSANRTVIGPPPSYRLKIGQMLTIPRL